MSKPKSYSVWLVSPDGAFRYGFWLLLSDAVWLVERKLLDKFPGFEGFNVDGVPHWERGDERILLVEEAR